MQSHVELVIGNVVVTCLQSTVAKNTVISVVRHVVGITLVADRVRTLNALSMTTGATQVTLNSIIEFNDRACRK